MEREPRYGRYWDEGDDVPRHERRHWRERAERQRGGYGRWRDDDRAAWRETRDWRETDPYERGYQGEERWWRGEERPYERGWGHGAYPGGGYRGREERGYPGGYHAGTERGGYGGRFPRGYEREHAPHYGMEDERWRGEERERWEGRQRWGEEEEPGMVERIGEGIRRFFGGERERGPHWGKGPKGYRRSDERIREDVCDRIADYGWIDASDVEVRVHEGEVTLSGTIRERRDKRTLEELVEDVPGVRDVHNQLRTEHDGQRRMGLQDRGRAQR